MGLGPPVVAGELRYTSMSQITTFDPVQYGGCPRRWYYKYVLNLPEPPFKAGEIGENVHKQIEHYLKTGENTLGDLARAGQHLLPKPGKDLEVEYSFGYNGQPLTANG